MRLGGLLSAYRAIDALRPDQSTKDAYIDIPVYL